MSGDAQIIRLSRAPRDVRRFLEVSYGIYRHDPLWVAPLLADLTKLFSDRNPFFEHAEMQLWVATRAGRDVGRIAGIIDRNHNRCHADAAAFFGFFEAVPDPPVSARLFEELSSWARHQGMQRVLGPMNPSTNDECGLLIEGHDSPPVFMMTYNPPYYAALIQAAGFQKAKDLFAFRIQLDRSPRGRLERLAESCAQRQPDLDFHPVLRKSLAKDLVKIKAVYNAAWEKNWGFVPMTDAGIHFLAERLKPLMMEGLVWLAETPEEPVAFLLALPDYNQAIRPLKGRLLSPALPVFLAHWAGFKRPELFRLIAFGVTPKFRGRGVESVLFAETLKFAGQAGFRSCEASWILEDNVAVQRLIEIFGGQRYKRYRIYERSLA